MFLPSTGPYRVNSIEIRDVECVEATPLFGGKCQLFVVGLLGETSVRNRDNGNASRTKSRDQIAVHRVFVDVDLDLAHRWRSAPVLCFEGLCLPRLEFEICVDLRLVGVVVGESRMNLRQRQGAKLDRKSTRLNY